MLRLLLESLADLNSKVRSSDPILDVLSVDPGTVLGRRYAGYCLFLFGAPDEELATWFSRNLVALDSLTGSDIACVVIAARVKLRVDRESLKKHRQSLVKDGKGPSSDIEVGDIKRQYASVDRMVSNGTSLWSGTTKEITAVTYATDAFARRLGVLNALPCLIVIDAFPSESYELLRLDDYASASLIPLLREVMHRFHAQENHFFFESLSRAEELQGRLDALDGEIRQAEEKLSVMKVKDAAAALRHLRLSVRSALIDGNAPAFARSVQSAHVAPEERASAYETVAKFWPELRQLSKTLNNLDYFLAQNIWPLQNEWLTRVALIYDRYTGVCAASSDTYPQRHSREYCLETIDCLRRRQDFLVTEVMKGWRDIDELSFRLREDHEQQCQRAAASIRNLRQERGRVSGEFEQSVQEILSKKYPSLKDTFRDVARLKKIRTARNSVGEVLLKMSASLLKPEMLLKIAEALK